MSFCWRHQTCKHKFQSFPKQAMKKIVEPLTFEPQDRRPLSKARSGKKTSLSFLCRGSYTLEAAVIIPIAAIFFMTILFFFRVLQVQTQVQEALYYSSRKTACEASAVSSETALRISAEVYFRKELSSYELPDQYIYGGKYAVTLGNSDFSGSDISLQANYYMKLPVTFFSVKGISVQQQSASHKWIGDREHATEEDYVYITEHGTVYHRSRNCHYLDLSIQTAAYGKIPYLRNKNDHKYYACSECVAENTKTETVYLTNYGTRYHSSLSCSGLKRTIYLISIEKVGDKGPCGKCGGSEKGG